MSSNRISTTVKERRKDPGITQQELSQKAGVGLRFIRDLEQGKPTAQLAKVNQVLFMFGLEPRAVPIDRERLLKVAGTAPQCKVAGERALRYRHWVRLAKHYALLRRALDDCKIFKIARTQN